MDVTTWHNAPRTGGIGLDPQTLARRFTAGGTIQELTSPSSQVNANQVFRVWREPDSVVLKVYGSSSRQRRELHALNALADWGHTPEILDSGSTGGLNWIVFVDAGKDRKSVG